MPVQWPQKRPSAPATVFVLIDQQAEWVSEDLGVCFHKAHLDDCRVSQEDMAAAADALEGEEDD